MTSPRRAWTEALAQGGVMTATLVLVAWSVAPVVWQALTALKPDAQITRSPTQYLPAPPTLEHFATLWDRKPFGVYLLNSVVVSACATLVAVVLAAMAALALRRLPTTWRNGLLAALLAVSVFPPIMLLYPLYEALAAAHALNHRLGLIVPYAGLALPLAIWILESGIRQIPSEVDEAAVIDGMPALSRLFRIHLPLAAPSLVTAAILVFIFCWNEFMLAVTFMSQDGLKTATAGIASVSGSSIYEIPWGQLSAAILMTTAPLMALVLFFERRITSGLTRGAVKG